MKQNNPFAKVLFLILFVSLIVQIHVKGQSANQHIEMIAETQRISDVSFTPFLNERSEMILVSELHNISSTYQILEGIASQTLTKGFGYIIQEMPLSYSILCNEYIENGDTSLLNLISSSNEAKNFYQKIRELSLQNTVIVKPKFFGIDFELSEGRIKYMKVAVKILLSKYTYDSNIQKVLKEISLNKNLKEIKALRNELRLLLNQNSNAQITSDEGYDLLRLFANRNDEYFKHRDAQLFQNFSEIDSMIRKTNPQPKYLGSLGLAHVKTSLKNSFTSILLKDPYWTNRIDIIGTHYYQCISNYGLEKETLVNDLGVLPTSISKFVQSRIGASKTKTLLVAKPIFSKPVKREFSYALFLILIHYPGETKNPFSHGSFIK
jgi:hypothetical protein